jgi:hypothetical protein
MGGNGTATFVSFTNAAGQTVMQLNAPGGGGVAVMGLTDTSPTAQCQGGDGGGLTSSGMLAGGQNGCYKPAAKGNDTKQILITSDSSYGITAAGKAMWETITFAPGAGGGGGSTGKNVGVGGNVIDINDNIYLGANEASGGGGASLGAIIGSQNNIPYGMSGSAAAMSVEVWSR